MEFNNERFSASGLDYLVGYFRSGSETNLAPTVNLVHSDKAAQALHSQRFWSFLTR